MQVYEDQTSRCTGREFAGNRIVEWLSQVLKAFQHPGGNHGNRAINGPGLIGRKTPLVDFGEAAAVPLSMRASGL
jgi:hypothetical protein